MYKILLVIFVCFLTHAVADISYSDNPNLWLDWGKDNSKKETPYDLIYEKNDKIFKGYRSDKKGKWISSISIEDARKISDLIDRNIKNIKNIPYVFVSSNKFPFFKIIRGFIYNFNYREGYYALKFKNELYIKINNIDVKFSINDFSGYVFSSPTMDNYALPYYAFPILREYSLKKNIEFIEQRVNPFKNMPSMMFDNAGVKDSDFINDTPEHIWKYKLNNTRAIRFNYLAAIEFKELKIKKFGKEVIQYASRHYVNNVLRKYQEPVFAIAFDKKGAQDIANYMCRKGFNLKAAKENEWNWDLVDKNFPRTNNKLYKCEKPLEYYMRDDKLWQEFLKYYK